MPKPWAQQPGEPALWYARFHEFMLLGPERTLEQAYRKFREGAQTGVDPASRTPPGRLPGSWSEKSREWSWIERSRSYDADERERLRRAHYAKLKAMNERHQASAQAVFSRALKAIVAASHEGLTLPQAIACWERAVAVERRVMGEPLGITLDIRGTRPGDSDFDDAVREASDVSPDRFHASPEVLAAVNRIMAQHENPKVYPDEPDADAQPLAPTEEGEQVIAEPAPPQADEPDAAV